MKVYEMKLEVNLHQYPPEYLPKSYYLICPGLSGSYDG